MTPRPSTRLRTGAIEDALVVALRALPPGEKGVATQIRPTIGCTAAELSRAIEKLRMQGKILWGRLELAGSMRIDDQDSASSSPEDNEAGSDPSAGLRCSAAPESSGGEPEARAADAPTGAGGEGEAEAELLQASAGAGGGGEDMAPPPPPAAPAEPLPGLVDGPTGAQLCAEIAAYLARTGMAKSRFGELATGNTQLVENVREAKRPRPRTVRRVRDFIAAHPDGVPIEKGARPRLESYGSTAGKAATERAKKLIEAAEQGPGDDAPLADRVRHEAEVVGARRRLARSIGSGAQTIAVTAPRSLVEQIQTALAEEPVDLMRAVNRRHPLLWQRVLALGRRDGDAMPSLALWRAIEAGLDLLERRP